MPGELSARQTVPLTTEDRKRLRRAAAELEVSPGLLARALILYGLKHRDDPEIAARIADEASAAHARASAAGKAAMEIRYGRERPDDDDEGKTS